MDIVECLMKTGFTRHESILYLVLCKEGELTGYEAAKLSGIPRSNAYLALAGLVDKGGAFRIDSDAVKYAAVPAKELVFNLRRQLDTVFNFIERNAPEKELEHDPYITISGKRHIVNKVNYLINSARQRVYLSVSPMELEYVRKELDDARDRGLKIVIITSQPFEMEGVVVYYNEKRPGQIRLITDTEHVLTGELSDREDCSCLYSKNSNLVQLIKDSLTNEIKLISVERQNGHRKVN